VINRRAIELTIRLGLALGCQIAQFSRFDRKNYFYPDLMKGYQISQYDLPLCGRGELRFTVGAEERVAGITRVHLEEDTAKHTDRSGYSLIDVNRGGVPLIEIVGEPDLRSPDDAREFTLPQRSKEFAHDYRYFPEPDLPPLAPSRQWVGEIRAAMPELPAVRRDRYAGLGLSAYDATLIAAEREYADLFDAAIA